MEEPIKVKTLQSRLQNAHFALTIVLPEQFASSGWDIAICFVKGELMWCSGEAGEPGEEI